MEGSDIMNQLLYVGCVHCGQKIKELTDEEINEIVWQQNILLGNDALKKFARAILRKAQEK